MSNQSNADMGDVHLREALLDRLNLLENRIHQLSQELDDGGRFSGGDHNTTTTTTFPAEKQRQMQHNSSRRESGSPFRSGSSNYQSQMSQKKAHSVSKPKSLMRSICSYIFCTDDDSCCLKSQLSDNCEGRGAHAGCYH